MTGVTIGTRKYKAIILIFLEIERKTGGHIIIILKHLKITIIIINYLVGGLQKRSSKKVYLKIILIIFKVRE